MAVLDESLGLVAEGAREPGDHVADVGLTGRIEKDSQILPGFGEVVMYLQPQSDVKSDLRLPSPLYSLNILSSKALLREPSLSFVATPKTVPHRRRARKALVLRNQQKYRNDCVGG